MSKKHDISLTEAYSVKSPEDNIRLYANWAETYDTDFVEKEGYIAYLGPAKQLLKNKSDISGPVLDVGCGTGVVGVVLHDGGIETVDGLDISEEMLAQSRRKRGSTGQVVYRNLIPADLTQRIDIDDNVYAGIVSAGTFTHGHLKPESLDELWRVAKPGAYCSIGINPDHFKEQGFSDKISADVAAGKIRDPQLVQTRAYTIKREDNDPGNNVSLVLVCRVV
jgi:ubiquinone/menaquinone biosynthesis C-methylase UbiE